MEKKNESTLNIEALKDKYGKLYAITATLAEDDDSNREVSYYFKKPTALSYDRFVKTASTGATKASRAFVLDAVVEEQRPLLVADLEEYPALVLTMSDKLLALLGLSQEATVKKL